jgi:hypothetical protein
MNDVSIFFNSNELAAEAAKKKESLAYVAYEPAKKIRKIADYVFENQKSYSHLKIHSQHGAFTPFQPLLISETALVPSQPQISLLPNEAKGNCSPIVEPACPQLQEQGLRVHQSKSVENSAHNDSLCL